MLGGSPLKRRGDRHGTPGQLEQAKKETAWLYQVCPLFANPTSIKPFSTVVCRAARVDVYMIGS